MNTGLQTLDYQTLMGQSLGNRLKTIDPTQKKAQDGKMEDKDARRVAEEYEAVFLSQMFAHMFEGIETDGMFGGGKAEEIFRSMMIDEYGKMAAKSGGIGIADSLYAEIIRMQEAQYIPDEPNADNTQENKVEQGD